MVLAEPRWSRLASYALLAALSVLARTAQADTFLYRDRNGAVHAVAVAATEGETAAPAPVATSTEEEYPYAAYVEAAADEFSVPASLVRAVMSVESSFHPFAISSAGARGLMQLMPRTADELGVADAFDPEQNIRAGAHQLHILLDTFGGDLRLTVAAYNAGAAAVRRAHGVPPIAETQRYVHLVLAHYASWNGHPAPSH